MLAGRHSILVVDDEPAQRLLLSSALGQEYAVTTAAQGREACDLLSARGFDLVITDERMPMMDGLQLIRWIRERDPDVPILVLTAYGSVETAVAAMKLGAQEYLTKPLKSPEELRIVVARALQQRLLRNRSLIHQAETEAQFPPDIVAASEAMREVLRLATQVAPQPTTVLLTGESGTGKEVVARWVHRASPREEHPFVAVNCAALAENLLESELFGHEKGAFTGAVQSRAGRFELAQGGTLFLDEIGEMSFNLQAKLLRVLQEQQFERVGGTRTITADVRVVAATNRDLLQAIAERAFREDLFYRLNVFPIAIPPLRERREDILPLTRHFAQKLALRMGRDFRGIRREAEERFLAHDWPGNVRELQNAVERALIVMRGPEISIEDLPFRMPPPSPMNGHPSLAALPRTLAEIEKEAILTALERNQGDRKQTAEELQISLRTLQYRLKDYGIAGRD